MIRQPPGATPDLTESGRVTYAAAMTRQARQLPPGAGAARPRRPDWDTYFMDIIQVVKRRGNCLRRQVAALIVKERRIIATGYNGTPSGIRNCDAGGCPRCAGGAPSGERLGDCICAHAEENAILQAACHGMALKNTALYCTESPCLLCAKLIITAGIREVVYERAYQRSRQVAALFREAGVRCRRFQRRARPAGRG